VGHEVLATRRRDLSLRRFSYVRGYFVFEPFRESITFFAMGIMIGANFIAVLIKLPIFILFAPVS
jgi:hypothetical protein